MNCIISICHSNKAQSFANHSHNEHEIIYIRSGKIILKNYAGEIPIDRPTLISIGNLEKHSIASGNGYDRYVIVLKPEYFPPDSEQLFSFFLSQFQITDVSKIAPKLDVLFDFLYEMFENNASGNDSGCLIILQTILLLLRNGYPDCFPAASGDMALVVRDIQSKLQKDLQNNYTPALFAEEYHVGLFHLLHSFKNVTGYSMGQYRLMYKIRMSCELLGSTNDSISMICDRIGFSDMSNYSRYFKRIMGCTPSQFRKNKRDEK